MKILQFSMELTNVRNDYFGSVAQDAVKDLA